MTKSEIEIDVLSFPTSICHGTIRIVIKHNNVMLFESDKGNRMIIIYREEYDAKILALLYNDTYKVVLKDPRLDFRLATKELSPGCLISI